MYTKTGLAQIFLDLCKSALIADEKISGNIAITDSSVISGALKERYNNGYTFTLSAIITGWALYSLSSDENNYENLTQEQIENKNEQN